MDRLNQLVAKNPSLQRLRDTSTLLMLADRQQEELINYVNSLMMNVRFTNQGRDFSWGVQPVIKDVQVMQGAVCSVGSTFSISAETSGSIQVSHARQILPLPGFPTAKDTERLVWVGFVSDVRCSGQWVFKNNRKITPQDDMDAYYLGFFSQFVKPFSLVTGSDVLESPSYARVTDTSPLVSFDGGIGVDCITPEMLNYLQAVLTQRGLEWSAERGSEYFISGGRFSFTYVGLLVSFAK